MEFTNRSGKITVELNDDFTAKGYIDGKMVYKGSIFSKVNPRQLIKGGWEVEESSEKYIKKYKSGATEQRTKMRVLKNPLKDFYQKHAVTPSLFCKVFNAVVYKSAIAPYKEFQTLYFGRKSVQPSKFKRVVENHDALLQALIDNQKNILPFVAMGYAPQEAKKVFGKGLWKKLCANTLHRNKLLCEKVAVGRYVEFDSGALKHEYPDAAHWAKNTCSITYKMINSKVYDKAVSKALTLFLDTRRMAIANQQTFNPKWSRLKMQEKHDEYMTASQREAKARRKERDEAYRLKMEKLERIDLSKVYPQTVFEQGGVTATILTTYSQIREEGVVMKHCVGSYAESCMSGSYCVVHISGDGEETTLGLHEKLHGWNGLPISLLDLKPNLVFQVSQHYGKYNSAVVSEKHKAMVDIVLKYLNDLKLTKGSYE